MRYSEIDIGKSKNEEKLIYIESIFMKIGEPAQLVITIVLFCVMALLFFIDQLDGGKYLSFATMLLIVIFTVSCFLIYSMIHSNRLYRYKGIDPVRNREIVAQVTKLLDFEFYRNNRNMAIISPNWNPMSFNWGRKIIIIYDKQDLLINCTTYALFDTKSPFHWFSNREYEKKFMNIFKEFANNEISLSR